MRTVALIIIKKKQCKSVSPSPFMAIFLVYKHWFHISFDNEICQPRNKRSCCFNSHLASGWYINNNGWRNEKYRYPLTHSFRCPKRNRKQCICKFFFFFGGRGGGWVKGAYYGIWESREYAKNLPPSLYLHHLNIQYCLHVAFLVKFSPLGFSSS